MEEKNTYSNYARWRITAILCALAFALIFYIYNSTIFSSPYDSFMIRAIFRDPQAYAGQLEIPVGTFWKWMRVYIAGSFLAGSIVLVTNTNAVNSNRKSGALCDIITYAVLALTIPVYFAVSMIAARAYYVRFLSVTFGINAGAFIGFAIMFFSHIRLYKANRDHFVDGKDGRTRKVISIVALFVPMVFMFVAVGLAAGYSHNYGTFRGHALATDVNVGNMLYNYYNGAVEYDGCLYFDSAEPVRRPGSRNLHMIYRVDIDGNLTHLADIGIDGSYPASLRFDVYGDDIYYVIIEREDDEHIRYSFAKVNITTGSSSVLLSDTIKDEHYMSTSRTYVDMFKILDGKLYFHIHDDGDNSIYYLDLEGDPSEKKLFVSDIFYTEDTYESLTYRFLYGYFTDLGTGFGNAPFFNHGGYHYYIDRDYEDREEMRVPHFMVKRVDAEKNYETIFDSPYVDKVCLYDGIMYIFNFDTGELFALDIESGEHHVHATIPNESESYFIPISGIWAYGDNLIISIDDEPFVIAR